VGQAARLIAALVVLTAAAPEAAADFALTVPHGGLMCTALVHAPAGTRAAWRILSLYRDAVDAHDDLDFESRALEVIGEIVRSPSKIAVDRPALSRARDYVHDHYRDRMTMGDIASAADLHPVYFGQTFHRETGETVGNYVARLRVRAAADDLCTTGASLADVALDHGFCDQSHFTNAFRRVFGVTPGAWR